MAHLHILYFHSNVVPERGLLLGSSVAVSDPAARFDPFVRCATGSAVLPGDVSCYVVLLLNPRLRSPRQR